MKYNNDLFVEHLKGMVQIPTVSSVDPDKIDKEAYLQLHAYLEKAYPLVHKTMTKEVVGRVGLIYHWKGTGKSGKLPLLLTGHQDVVPEGDHSMWKHPPYEGVIADGCLWGRGSTDSKCNLQAYFDAIELLIADGFVPDYDIYITSGYNEEIMGGPEAAAGLITDAMKKRGIELGMAIDECGGISKQGDQYVATLYFCEKGYADFEFSYNDVGGHSAQPGKHTALGIIGQTICLIEQNQMPRKKTQPVVDMLKAMAPFAPEERKAMYADPDAHWDELVALAEEGDRFLNCMTRTTTAVTMAKGSDQANILPERAYIITNSRLLPGETLEDLEAHFKTFIPEGVQVRLVKGHNPPLISSIDTSGYRLIQKICEEKYPGVKFVPSMLFGGTDSRFYSDMSPTKSVYRFTGLKSDSRWGGAHQVNERIACDILTDNVDFYVRLIKEYGSAE